MLQIEHDFAIESWVKWQFLFPQERMEGEAMSSKTHYMCKLLIIKKKKKKSAPFWSIKKRQLKVHVLLTIHKYGRKTILNTIYTMSNSRQNKSKTSQGQFPPFQSDLYFF